MKKIIFGLMTVGLLLTFQTQITKAADVSASSSVVLTKTEETVRTKEALLLRLHEIKAMDKSKMNSSEKLALRTEVRSIQYYYHHHYGYYSLTFLVLVVLLVVILV